MTAQSPGAYFLSALLHGAVAGLILFFAYTADRIPEAPPRIMELVAGSGDNYAATSAPALGVPGGIKVRIPVPLPTPPAVEPSPPEPAPVAALPAPAEKTPLERAHVSKNQAKEELARKSTAKPVAKPVAKAAAKPALRPPNFVRDIQRLIRKREARLEKIYQEKLAREREHEAREAAVAAIKHIDAEGIREGVVGGSQENTRGGAEGKALTREEGSLMESYYAFVLQHLKVTFEELKPQDVSDSLSAVAEFMLAADGSISGGRIVRSSGNAEFDRAVLECLAHAKSVGPRPDHKSEISSTTFTMKDEAGP